MIIHIFSDNFKVGDLVILSEDEDFVGEQSRKFLKGQGVYHEEIARSMLGNTYPIVPTESMTLDVDWVALLNDDGKKVHFPKTTVRKVEHSKWTYLGITRNQGNRPFF